MTKRILVVEDQQDNRQIVRDLLVANDYELTEAENGEEAFLLVAKAIGLQEPWQLLGRVRDDVSSD